MSKLKSSKTNKSSSARPSYQNTNNHIFFKSNKHNGYSFLSNFFPYVDDKSRQAVYDLFELTLEQIKIAEQGFIVDNVYYPSREHFYQSQKWKQYPEIAIDILQQPTALDAKKKNTVWKNKLKKQRRVSSDKPAILTETQLIDIMLQAVDAHFSQNPILKMMLFSTEGKLLSEIPGRSGGNLWATGPKPTDQDMLGRILESVRDALLDEYLEDEEEELRISTF